MSNRYSWEDSSGKFLHVEKLDRSVDFGTSSFEMNDHHQPMHQQWMRIKALNEKDEEAKKTQYESKRIDDL